VTRKADFQELTGGKAKGNCITKNKITHATYTSASHAKILQEIHHVRLKPN
jgi:hypothetical protein